MSDVHATEPEAVPERGRLQQAMDLITAEVTEIIAADKEHEPRTFQRVDKLMRICKALRTQASMASYKLSPDERNAALGLRNNIGPGGLYGGPVDDLGLDDNAGNCGLQMPAFGPYPLGGMPHQDRDYSTERQLAALEGSAAKRRLDDANARLIELDEALRLGQLATAAELSPNQRAAVNARIDAILSKIGDTRAHEPDPPAPSVDVVPADIVR